MLCESCASDGRSSNRATPKIQSEKFGGATDRKLFRVLAKHRFPRKTAQSIRALTGEAESTIYDWLAGKSDAPFSVYIALLAVR